MDGDDFGVLVMVIIVVLAIFGFGASLGFKAGEFHGMQKAALHVCNNTGYQYATVKEIDDKIEIFCYNETPLYEEGGEK